MPRPIPLAIGLIGAEPDSTSSARSQARLRMGVFAFREGYALAETFEITGQPVRDDATQAALTQLAERCYAKVLLVADDVPSAQINCARSSGLLSVMLVPGVLLRR